MRTALSHTLKEIEREASQKRFGTCQLEAEIGVRDDGVYINVHDYSLGDDYTLVGFAALRIENGKLVLVSSTNEQLDVGGGDESRSDVYDPEEPYPSERIEAQEERQKLLEGIAGKHNTDWDYARRWRDDTTAGGLDFEDELVNSHGAHFHLWIPRSDPGTEADLIQGSVQTLRGKRDVIDWSWDYIPEERAL